MNFWNVSFVIFEFYIVAYDYTTTSVAQWFSGSIPSRVKQFQAQFFGGHVRDVYISTENNGHVCSINK